jgi:hypothetical protein
MIWQAEAHMRFRILTGRGVMPQGTLNGTGSLSRAITKAMSPGLTGNQWQTARYKLLLALRQQHVTAIILRQTTLRPQYVRLFSRMFGPPIWVAGVALWNEHDCEWTTYSRLRAGQCRLVDLSAEVSAVGGRTPAVPIAAEPGVNSIGRN